MDLFFLTLQESKSFIIRMDRKVKKICFLVENIWWPLLTPIILSTVESWTIFQ